MWLLLILSRLFQADSGLVPVFLSLPSWLSIKYVAEIELYEYREVPNDKTRDNTKVFVFDFENTELTYMIFIIKNKHHTINCIMNVFS